jgi:hypothetical protein
MIFFFFWSLSSRQPVWTCRDYSYIHVELVKEIMKAYVIESGFSFEVSVNYILGRALL